MVVVACQPGALALRAIRPRLPIHRAVRRVSVVVTRDVIPSVSEGSCSCREEPSLRSGLLLTGGRTGGMLGQPTPRKPAFNTSSLLSTPGPRACQRAVFDGSPDFKVLWFQNADRLSVGTLPCSRRSENGYPPGSDALPGKEPTVCDPSPAWRHQAVKRNVIRGLEQVPARCRGVQDHYAARCSSHLRRKLKAGSPLADDLARLLGIGGGRYRPENHQGEERRALGHVSRGGGCPLSLQSGVVRRKRQDVSNALRGVLLLSRRSLADARDDTLGSPPRPSLPPLPSPPRRPATRAAPAARKSL